MEYESSPNYSNIGNPYTWLNPPCIYIYIIGLKSPPIAMIGLTTVRFMIIIPYHDNTYAFHKHYQLTIGHYPIMFGLTLLTTTINTVND